MLRKNRDVFFFFSIAILQGILEIRTKKPNVEQLRLLQLIVLYSKEWREGVFTPKVKYPIGGDLPSEHSAEVWIRAVIVTALPAAATGHEHPLFVRRRAKLQDFFKSFQYICECE